MDAVPVLSLCGQDDDCLIGVPLQVNRHAPNSRYWEGLRFRGRHRGEGLAKLEES